MKLLARLVAAVDDVDHVRAEDEGRAVAFEGAKALGIAQKLAKVNVKNVTRRLDHDVVVVTVADAQ